MVELVGGLAMKVCSRGLAALTFLFLNHLGKYARFKTRLDPVATVGTCVLGKFAMTSLPPLSLHTEY